MAKRRRRSPMYKNPDIEDPNIKKHFLNGIASAEYARSIADLNTSYLGELQKIEEVILETAREGKYSTEIFIKNKSRVVRHLENQGYIVSEVENSLGTISYKIIWDMNRVVNPRRK